MVDEKKGVSRKERFTEDRETSRKSHRRRKQLIKKERSRKKG